MQHLAFIGLGSNLEDPHSQLRRAFAALGELPGTCLIAQSSMYRSAPMGFRDQPDFVNAVAKVATELSPQALLQALLQIEQLHGRERTFRNSPRTLDLDILLYDNMRLHENGLTIPHPQMHRRAFVLLPLLEIAPDASIPAVGEASIAMLDCHDQTLERIADGA
jgi:2-amino-4-hydroxy-6-hydroxymethyldihydropteridine diphosphokinase